MKHILLLVVSSIFGLASAEYNNQCNDNIVDYWGQNSYGAANINDPSSWQQSLRYYCDDDAIDVIPISFLTTFFSVGGVPQINLSNYCNSVNNTNFPGTSLGNCQYIAPEIRYCQRRGKLITLSLGGATGGAGFQSSEQAVSFADTIWNLFLGGNSITRPFGDAVLDGIDLDIEGGGPNYYVTFLNKLNSYFRSSSKKYRVTAAPQCIFPDANLQSALNGYPFDAVYVQFYNNPCGLQNFNSPSQWNFGIWDIWARNISPNPNVKIYIGAPGSPSAAGAGYVPANTLLEIALITRSSFPSFGGVMFWDASQARKNNRIDATLKNGLRSGRRCDNGFVYRTCTAPSYVYGASYTTGATVSYNGYMWTSKWWTANAPSGNVNNDWSPISACSGSGTLPINIRPSPTVIYLPPVSVATSNSILPAGSCSGVNVWSNAATYTAGMTAVYNSDLWKAAWWSLNDTPGNTSGAWIRVGRCTLLLAARSFVEEEDCKYTRWKNTKTYKAGNKVIYKGHVFKASSSNNNQTPDSNTLLWEKDNACSKR